MSFHVPERYRILSGRLASRKIDGNNGAFHIPLHDKMTLTIASDGMGWEHVSISFPDCVPTWDEMCRIKAYFWDDEDLVVQFHPPKSQYVNNHPFCLHLWRPVGAAMPAPPSILVGIGQGAMK